MVITCPTCKAKTTWEENRFRPFCSERCKLIDLGQWASESYRIAGPAINDNEDDPKKGADEDAAAREDDR